MLITDNTEEAQLMLEMVNETSKVGLKLNLTKTQFMTNLVLSGTLRITNDSIEQTHIYKYLGHKINIGRDNQTHEIRRRMLIKYK